MDARAAMPLVIGLFLFAPTASGNGVLFALDAVLVEPPRASLEGALLVGPDDWRHYADLRVTAAIESRGAVVIVAERVALGLQRWVHGGAGHASLAYVPPLSREGADVDGTYHDATLTLERVRPWAQWRLEDVPETRKPIGRWEAAGAQCDVRLAVESDQSAFPDDPARAGGMGPRSPDRPQLVAECDVGRFQAAQTFRAMVYDVDAWLSTPDLEGPRLVRTGTFPEVVNGVPTGRNVTQVLVVTYVGVPFVLDLPGPGRAVFYASQFVAAGTLRTEPASGWLRWGPVTLEGSLDPVEAVGSFALQRGDEDRLLVDGSTLNAPHSFGPAGAAAAGPVSAWLAPFAAVAALGGIVYLLWLLYARLRPGSLLTHPHRARMMELVRAEPGIDEMGLVKALDLPRPTARYHLLALRAGGHIALHRVGGRTALFPTRAGYRGREVATALRRRPTHARVLAALGARAGLTQAELSFTLGLTRARMCQVLKQLREAREVRAERRGRFDAYFLAPPQSGSVDGQALR